MARADFPRTMAEFRDRLASEEDRRRHLVACRWPDGFRRPRRGSRDAYDLAGRELGLTARHAPTTYQMLYAAEPTG